MKCKDCACYKDMWCTMVTDRPDPDMERDCAHITREQVEKMRGAWVYMTDDDGCTWTECPKCEYELDSLEEPQNFCPRCGSPMTDEAVDILWKRLEAMHNAD